MDSPDIQILVVDDNVAFRDALLRFLQRQRRFVVIGVAGTGAEAVTMGQVLEPDLVLMDAVLPDFSGYEAAQRLRTPQLALKVIMMTLHNDPAYQNAATLAGADGFVTKTELTTDLIPQIQRLFPINAAA